MQVRLELWTKDQGGRHTPVFDQFRPDFRAATEGHGDLDLGAAAVTLPTDRQMMMPGETVEVDLAPASPAAWANVGVDLVLGVFEDTRQIGAATVLSA